MRHHNTILLFAFVFMSIVTKAQDVIVKTDKSEIKAKVIELTDNTIKYKNWDNLDGPIYNISKSDVFIIIYANGKREIIKKDESSKMETKQTLSLSSEKQTGSGLSKEIANSKAIIDTSVNYKDQKLRYRPMRINFGLQSPLSFGIDQEVRIVKNLINMGVTARYDIYKDETILESTFGFIYGSIYAPINRLTGDYENQNKGLFAFGQVGYGISYMKIEDYLGKQYTSSSGNFTWRIGADYFISKSFGLSVSTFEFKTFYGGIVVTFL